MFDPHSVFHPAYRDYLTTLEGVLRECGTRYGLDDLELREVVGPPHARTEIWLTREDRRVGWCELRMEMKGDRLIYTIFGGKPQENADTRLSAM